MQYTSTSTFTNAITSNNTLGKESIPAGEAVPDEGRSTTVLRGGAEAGAAGLGGSTGVAELGLGSEKTKIQPVSNPSTGCGHRRTGGFVPRGSDVRGFGSSDSSGNYRRWCSGFGSRCTARQQFSCIRSGFINDRVKTRQNMDETNATSCLLDVESADKQTALRLAIEVFLPVKSTVRLTISCSDQIKQTRCQM
jgi:hypothetical protein